VFHLSLNSKVLVNLPKKGIIVSHTGDYPYVYHVAKTYRDANGHPTNKKRSIGKLDKATGKLIPNNAYYEIYGEFPEIEISETAGEIHEVGLTFLTNWVFSSLGINNMLTNTFGEIKTEFLQLIVSYMLKEGNVMSYLDDFYERSLCKRFISDKLASRIFASISSVELH
jgi:hypothetical protein